MNTKTLSDKESVRKMAAGVKRSRLKAIAVGLKQRSRYPSRHMIIRRDGSVYWPQPDEGPLRREMMLEPWDYHLRYDWTAEDVLRTIDAK